MIKINKLIVLDDTASYIYGYDADTGKEAFLLYRG